MALYEVDQHHLSISIGIIHASISTKIYTTSKFIFLMTRDVFHRTASVNEIGALQVPWNCTARVIATGPLQVSWSCNEAFGDYTCSTFQMNPSNFIFSILIQFWAMYLNNKMH